MITLHCPMSRTLFTNIPIFSTLQNDINLPVVAYHHPNNSSDIFVRAQLPETDNCNNARATPGSFWCNSSKCTTCPYIDHGLHRNRSFRTLSQQQSLCFHMLLITIETLSFERHCLRKAREVPLIHKAKTIESLRIKKKVTNYSHYVILTM